MVFRSSLILDDLWGIKFKSLILRQNKSSRIYTAAFIFDIE